jgi:hypothetical protein
MTLRILLVMHAVITFAAGVVLVVAPGAIPGMVGIELSPGSFLICYLLAGAEFVIAFLSAYGACCRGVGARHAVIGTLIVFHGSTAALELYALMQGLDARLWANVALRIAVIALFAWFGLIKPPVARSS